MSRDLLILLILSLSFLVLFGIAELLYRFGKVRAEYTRKLVHTGTGLLTLLFPLYLDHIWQVAILCGAFLVLLILSKRYGFLPSINEVDRKTIGSIIYPVIVLIVFSFYQYMKGESLLFQQHIYFYLPILTMAICDPVAALSGGWYHKRYPAPPGKTWVGTVSFLVSGCLIGFLLLVMYSSLSFPLILVLTFASSFLAAITERYSRGGWDNFTIPLSVMMVLYVFSLIFNP